MSTVRVVVIGSNGQYFVRPSVAFLVKPQGEADRIKLINRADRPLDVSQINVWPFIQSQPKGLDPGSHVLLDLDQTKPYGAYSYRIMLGPDQAVGNSDPVIIVDDP